jgi:hypothetical protein
MDLMEVELPKPAEGFGVVIGPEAAPEIILRDGRKPCEPFLEKLAYRCEEWTVDAVQKREVALSPGSRRARGALAVVEKPVGGRELKAGFHSS